MKNSDKVIITLSREYGSGGREVGRILAENLGISFYDKIIMDFVAEEHGLPTVYVKDNEQIEKNRFLHDIISHNYYSTWNNQHQYTPLPNHLLETQSKLIRSLADKESCVIVGRCADYLLRHRSDCIRVFIYADTESKVERAVSQYGVDAKNPESILRKVDELRADYYNNCTDKEWGHHSNYDLCINTGFFSVAEAAETIKSAIKSKFNLHL